MTILGPSLTNVMIAVGLSDVPLYVRLVRGTVLSAKENGYVEAAKGIGCSRRLIIMRHILPNIVAPFIVVTTLEVANAILLSATLSFLGMGAQPPSPEWGAMLNEGRRYIRTAWWMITFPGLMIMISVLGINLLGDGLRDALDPKLSE
jgi:peptide/nickel transport system permease protein